MSLPNFPTSEQLARAHDLLRDAVAAGIVTKEDATRTMLRLGASPTARALRDACSGLLLDLAARGRDELYNAVAQLEAELAGEGSRPTAFLNLLAGQELPREDRGHVVQVAAAGGRR